MPVTATWENEEKTLLHVTFTGELRRGEFLEIIDQENEMYASILHTADLIVDFRGCTRVPVDLLSLSSMLTRRMPANMGGIVFVGEGSTLEFIFGVWSKLYRNMNMVTTPEEAYRWLDEIKVVQ